ncbi:uncharacterized protein LOC116081529, partial [Mastomys coucha]|uniref:uncharacterized protein LOC116081529 n=1 Tax=Mastomys coucha TaxID=35658 RepID=UPI0012617773
MCLVILFCCWQLQEKEKKRRQALTGGGTCQREAEQRREPQRTQQSSLEEPSAATYNELPLHRDSLFPVCDKSGDVGHQLSQAIFKDGTAPSFCMASTAPGTKASFILSSLLPGNQAGHPALVRPPEPLLLAQSILSPNRSAPLEGFFYPSTPLCNSLTAESTLPSNPPPSNPPLLPDPTPPSFSLPTLQKSEVVFKPEITRPLVNTLNEMPTNVLPARGTGYVRQAMPQASQQHPTADNQLSSDSENSFNQHLPAPHVFQVSLQGDRRTYHLEPEHLFSSNSDDLKLLQRLDKKGQNFLIAKKKEEEEEEEEKEEEEEEEEE